ncbi:uncharacterized protein LOC120069564 [Benincasa hispida]|uniref:uncharacterized protein LOC120069564 n=1 Tax=Benincasa hispida TaxID=102211 RepID=UPI0019011890|nr:uncharacterized protein LOC120069564 [Benincasa hispida]
MASSLVQLLASNKLTGDNYATWKSNLNTILVIEDLQFVLTEECPPVSGSNANRNVQETYVIWIRANEKACAYIPTSISDVLAKKYESMSTTREIMESLHGMFGQSSFSLKDDAIRYVYNCHMKEGTSVREHVLDMMVHFNMAKVNSAVVDENSQAYQTMMTAKGLESEVNVTTCLQVSTLHVLHEPSDHLHPELQLMDLALAL